MSERYHVTQAEGSRREGAVDSSHYFTRAPVEATRYLNTSFSINQLKASVNTNAVSESSL